MCSMKTVSTLNANLQKKLFPTVTKKKKIFTNGPVNLSNSKNIKIKNYICL